MTIEEWRWCRSAIAHGGGFVATFADACVRADEDNYEILCPALLALMAKYPQYLNWPGAATDGNDGFKSSEALRREQNLKGEENV